MVLSYPELPADVIAGRKLQRKKICRTFSDCTTAPRNGMVSGCYPLDPFYKQRPERAALQELKAAHGRRESPGLLKLRESYHVENARQARGRGRASGRRLHCTGHHSTSDLRSSAALADGTAVQIATRHARGQTFEWNRRDIVTDRPALRKIVERAASAIRDSPPLRKSFSLRRPSYRARGHCDGIHRRMARSTLRPRADRRSPFAPSRLLWHYIENLGITTRR